MLKSRYLLVLAWVENVLGGLRRCSASFLGAALPQPSFYPGLFGCFCWEEPCWGVYALGWGHLMGGGRMVSWSVPGVGVPIGLVWGGGGVSRLERASGRQLKHGSSPTFFVL